MKIDGNQIKIGNLLEINSKLWRVTKTQHTQPGKGGAYLQVELKALNEGTKINERFRSSESVERVRLDQRSYQYLYSDNGLINVMDIVIMVNFILGITIPTDEEFIAADVNEDGQLNVLDLIDNISNILNSSSNNLTIPSIKKVGIVQKNKTIKINKNSLIGGLEIHFDKNCNIVESFIDNNWVIRNYKNKVILYSPNLKSMKNDFSFSCSSSIRFYFNWGNVVFNIYWISYIIHINFFRFCFWLFRFWKTCVLLNDSTIFHGHDRTNFSRRSIIYIYGYYDGTSRTNGKIIFSFSIDVGQS